MNRGTRWGTPYAFHFNGKWVFCEGKWYPYRRIVSVYNENLCKPNTSLIHAALLSKAPLKILFTSSIQDSIDKLLSSFHQWEAAAYGTGEQAPVTTVVLAGCDSIQEQVDELDKAISVASRDPAYFGIDVAELEKRRKWTRTARDQVGTVKKKISAGKGLSYHDSHRELMRLPIDQSHPTETSNQYGQHNDDLISSESDRQLLLIKQQDEDLDLLSDSVQRIGHIGLNIHKELLAQVTG